MKRQCIVCEQPARSREHIFPAALGGRRVNKGIYCAKHNNEYGPLAATISVQLALFNSLLGIRNDHTGKAASVELEEDPTGRKVVYQDGELSLKAPEVVSERIDGHVKHAEMQFANRDQIQAWVKEQEAQGLAVSITKIQEHTYIPSALRSNVSIGGDREGLRSVGYIAQTFFAHYFPDAARSKEMSEFVQYTLYDVGRGYVSWQFNKKIDYPQNKFNFGHRVVVGLDRTNSCAYALVDFFSTLSFAVNFCSMTVETDISYAIDIDPFALSPPHDISEAKHLSTFWHSQQTDSSFDVLSTAIADGTAQAQLSTLMKRIEDHQRGKHAEMIIEKLALISGPRLSDIPFVAQELTDVLRPRVMRLMRYAVDNFAKQRGSAATFIREILGEFVRSNHRSPTGLSTVAAASLELACTLLATQIVAEYKTGTLTLGRIELLISGGPGVAIVMKPFFELVLRAIGENPPESW